MYNRIIDYRDYFQFLKISSFFHHLIIFFIFTHTFYVYLKTFNIIKYLRFYKKKPDFDYNTIIFDKEYFYYKIAGQK